MSAECSVHGVDLLGHDLSPGGLVCPLCERDELQARVGVVVGRLRQWAEMDDPMERWFLRRSFTVVARAKLLSMAAELEGLVPEQKGEEK